MPCAVYVMPLHRYFSGDFSRPAGLDAERMSTDAGGDPPDRARARVAEIQRSLGEAAKSPVAWEDEGEVALAERFDPYDLHAVRSLAAHEEYPARRLWIRQSFRLLDDPRDHPGLRRIFEGDETSYPHLMRHSDNKGFFVPAPLDRPLISCESSWWMIGSVPGCLAELDRLAPSLEGADPRLLAAEANLRRVFECAAATGLPVIIDG